MWTIQTRAWRYRAPLHLGNRGWLAAAHRPWDSSPGFAFCGAPYRERIWSRTVLPSGTLRRHSRPARQVQRTRPDHGARSRASLKVASISWRRSAPGPVNIHFCRWSIGPSRGSTSCARSRTTTVCFTSASGSTARLVRARPYTFVSDINRSAFICVIWLRQNQPGRKFYTWPAKMETN